MEGDDPSFLVSTGETPGVLSPVLDFPVRDKQEHTGESAKGHRFMP